jgi:hypothetical protein
MSEPERYGNRKMPKIISEWRALADACRAEGTPAIQAALDRVEPVIDAAFQGDAALRAARALGAWCVQNVAHNDEMADLLHSLDRALGNPPPDLKARLAAIREGRNG